MEDVKSRKLLNFNWLRVCSLLLGQTVQKNCKQEIHLLDLSFTHHFIMKKFNHIAKLEEFYSGTSVIWPESYFYGKVIIPSIT